MKKLTFLLTVLFVSLAAFAVDSEYCGAIMSSGNTEAAFTWETNDEGDVVITISETLGGAESATFFRGHGIKADKFKIGESKEDITTYFTHPGDIAGQQSLILTLTDPSKVPAPGTKIYVENQIIEYATSKDGNAWPTLSFEYTYGSKCSAESVLTKIALSASATFAKVGEPVTLLAAGKDQANKTMDVAITFEVSPADAGNFVGNVFTFAKVGTATITAKSGGVENSIILYGVPSDNLALNQPCEAGYEPGNAGEVSSKANDGNVDTQWVTYADQSPDVEWWIVDLGGKYDIAAIDVVWGDPTSTSYILQVRDELPTDEQKADDEAWETISEQTGITINSEQFISLAAASGRFVRLHSLAKSANFFRLKEVRVFGTEWVDSEDTEKPVMTSAELVSASWSKAVIAVAATDNHVVVKYHVVDATNGLDAKCIADNGQIVVNGLTPAKSYNLTITAIDGAGNESENSKVVALTTKNNVPSSAAPEPTWPVAQVKSLYSDKYVFAPASLASFNENWWQNPNIAEETIGENHYLHYDLYREGMIGAQFGAISVINMEKVHIDIWASAAGSLTFRLITNEDPAVNVPKTLQLEALQWNSFDIDLADFGEGHDWATLYQFAIEKYQAGGLVGEHISVDNIYLYRTTELADDEKPTELKATMASSSYFSVVLELFAKDNSGAVNYVVKNGEQEVATTGGASGATVHLNVPNLKANTDYTFAVIAKDDKGNETDPIEVQARTLAAPAAAPAPILTDKNVTAVFVDGVEGTPTIKIGDWSQTTITSFVELAAGDKVCFGSNFNYLGWELAPAVNADELEFLHVDLLSPVLTQVSVTPISPNHEGEVAVELVPGEWKSVDIELSKYAAAAIAWDNVYQFKFFNPNVNGAELFIDNVYFFKDNATAIDHVVEPAKATKLIENGQLIIIKNGIRYNVAGQMVK